MNQMVNNAAATTALAQWCSDYSEFALGLAKWFLIISLVVAVVETAIALWAKFESARKSDAAARGVTASAGADPAAWAKLLEALKGVLETLKGLPAWIAIFLAGLALLWIAARRPEACPQPPARPNAETPERTKTDGAKAAPFANQQETSTPAKK